MVKRGDFKLGERVAHITMGDGVVTSTDGEAVTVRFDRVDERGSHCVGIYDEVWFDRNPRLLFHRNTTIA